MALCKAIFTLSLEVRGLSLVLMQIRTATMSNRRTTIGRL